MFISKELVNGTDLALLRLQLVWICKFMAVYQGLRVEIRSLHFVLIACGARQSRLGKGRGEVGLHHEKREKISKQPFLTGVATATRAHATKQWLTDHVSLCGVTSSS